MERLITTTHDLETVAALVHDARFTAGSLEFDSIGGTFEMMCWVLETGTKRHTDAAWVAYRLTFSSVAAANVSKSEEVNYYEIATLKYFEDRRRLHIIAHYAIEITLDITALDGSLVETDESRLNWAY